MLRRRARLEEHTMSTSTLLCEDILIIGEEPAAKRVRLDRWNMIAWLVVGVIGGVVTLAMSVGIVNSLRESQRQECNNRLHRLGLAMHEYNEAHGRFPAPAIFNRNGKPLLSWRVALLPHLGYQSLYERFRLDESWDSPHNLALLAEMPREFACPGGPGRRAGRTSYMVIVGPANDAYSVNTAFEPKRGADIRHFTDGTSNTILVLETDAFVPWTKPDDLHWEKGAPLPGILSPHPGGAHSLFADGGVRFLKPTIRPETLLAILTMNGGEVTSAG
jgi:prepilin-type processing-associated H-X9-DG protein